MIGGFISDDYYFCFEEEDIKNLSFMNKISGMFFQPPNSISRKKNLVKKIDIYVHVQKKEKFSTVELETDIRGNVKALHFSKREFEILLLKPSKDILKYGGNGVRFASSNTFFLQPKSELFKNIKIYIEQKIKSGFP